MKPTMPMNAFPPGGPPGTPPPGGTPPPSGGGWGPPPGGPPGGPPSYGGPPSGGGFPQGAPPKKSKTGLYVGIGCGCLMLFGACIGGAVFFFMGLGPGEEVVSTPITIGQPFSLSYIQDGSQKYEAWLEVDVGHTSSYSLSGPILLSLPGAPFGQYNLAETGTGSPVTDRSSSTRINWVHSNSSTSGTTSLFPIPAQASGQSVTVSGTINAPPGTTGTIRLFVAKRD